MTPHAGELARLLGAEAAEIEAHRLEAVRRAASIFGSVVLLKGADTLVAAPREGVLVAGVRRAVARHGRHRRRAHRRRRRVPREGDGAAARRGGRRGRARPRLDARRAAARRSSRATSCRRSSARSPATAGSGSRSPSTCRAARSRSTSARCGGTRGALLDALGGAELWAVVKANALRARRRSTAGGRRSTAARRALCVATVAEALALRRALPERAHPRHGAGRDRRAAGRARGAARARRRRRGSPRGSRCTSSSTPAWAAGAPPSCRRRRATSSA